MEIDTDGVAGELIEINRKIQESYMEPNLALWDRQFKTDPSATKKVPKGGRTINAIDAYHQIKKATEEWGPMGKWGLRSQKLTVVGEIMWMDAEFFHPGGSFGTVNSINMYMGRGDKKRLDDEAGKKLATDTITKCLSLLGFNADVFFGLFDDARYVAEREKEEKAGEIERYTILKKECERLLKDKEVDNIISVEQYESVKSKLDKTVDIAGLERAKKIILGMVEVENETNSME